MNFLILNQYFSDNLGDKLINEMLCKNIKYFGNNTLSLSFAPSSEHVSSPSECSNKTAQIFTHLKHACPLFIKYLLKYKKKLTKLQSKKEPLSCDSIIIGGGQLCKHRSVFVYCMYNWLKYAQRTEKPLAIYGIGIDNNLNPFEISIYKKVFQYASYINVRDNNSALLLKKYFGITCDITPDIAFTYKPSIQQHSVKNKILVMPYNYQTAIRYFNIQTSYADYFEAILSLILGKIDIGTDYNITLSATTTEDFSECFRFHDFLLQKGIKSTVQEAPTIEALTAYFQECSCIITGRMHAMILALTCQKDIIPIEISDKITGFKNEFLSDIVNIAKLRTDASYGVKKCIDALQSQKTSTPKPIL